MCNKLDLSPSPKVSLLYSLFPTYNSSPFLASCLTPTLNPRKMNHSTYKFPCYVSTKHTWLVFSLRKSSPNKSLCCSSLQPSLEHTDFHFHWLSFIVCTFYFIKYIVVINFCQVSHLKVQKYCEQNVGKTQIHQNKFDGIRKEYN